MKKILLFLCILTVQLAMAGNVTPDEALKKARKFANSLADANVKQQMRMAARSSEIVADRAQSRTTEDPSLADAEDFYVFNIGENAGFVIVSADDRTPAILGYADSGAFDTEDIPDNMAAWLQDYASQIQALANSSVRVRSSVSEHKAVKPLLKSTWSQGSPYNNRCPYDGSERSVTGCVATAMAQVFYYHKYPEKTTATIPGYTTKTNSLTVSAIAPTTINWENMLDNYTGNESTIAKNAVATLMFLCGASVEMDFLSSGSGASSSKVADAMKTYFDYDASATYIDRDDYLSREWDEAIYNELANSRPVFYRGNSVGGGHAFVVDGCDRNGYYHVNWGWNGSSNGYFLLDILDPGSNSGIGASTSTDGYSFNHCAIVGVRPNTGEPVSQTVRMTTSGVTAQAGRISKLGDIFPVNYTTSIYNLLDDTYTFDLGVGVFDTNDNMVYSKVMMYNKSFDSGWGRSAFQVSCSVPATLPNGTYIISNISRESGTTEWHRNARSNKIHLTATITGDTLMLQTPGVDLSGEMALSGNMEVGGKITASTAVKNHSGLFSDIVFLLVDGEEVGGRHFDVEANATASLDMTFIPTSSGTKNVTLAYKNWTYNSILLKWTFDYVTIAQQEITVAEARKHTFEFSEGYVANAIGKNINDNVAQLYFKVKNIGFFDYNDDLLTYSLTRNADDSYYSVKASVMTPLKLSAGASKVVNVEAPLPIDGNYWFIVLYKSEGAFISLSDNNNRYDDIYNYNVIVPETPTAIVPVSISVKTPDAPAAIHDLQGRKVTNPRRGIYVVNGKKIVVR